MYIHPLFLGVKPADRRERSGYPLPEFERLVNSGGTRTPASQAGSRGFDPGLPRSNSIRDSITHCRVRGYGFGVAPELAGCMAAGWVCFLFILR